MISSGFDDKHSEGVSRDTFIRTEPFFYSMFGKSKRKPNPEGTSPYGGLENLTDEQIEKNIRDYPYVMGKLKDC